MTKTFFSKRADMYHYAASADYNGEYIRSANSHINGGDVWSYTTKVAMFDKDKEMLLYTGHYYSQTTSSSLSELRRAFDHFKCMKVYDFTVKDGWNRLKEAVKLHTKHPATRKDDKEYFIDTLKSFSNLVEYYGQNSKYIKSTTVDKALQISNKYTTEIEIKRKKAQERWEKRREEEERLRKERSDRTKAIVLEYDPNCNAKPETFAQCMSRRDVQIPMDWLEEHHPEVLTENKGGHRIKTNEYNFSRSYNYNDNKWYDFVEYRNNNYDDNCELLRLIKRYDNEYKYRPDILIYYSNKTLRTSQGCEVDDTAGHVKTLLGLFLKAIDEGRDTSFVIGKHCGPYEIREYNAAEKFLRVGCHCFLLENLREVYNDMKGE